jgi:hypothetical protein
MLQLFINYLRRGYGPRIAYKLACRRYREGGGK